jgi:ubiquinone/menaquinone biosynthesis C-methylase UbiE
MLRRLRDLLTERSLASRAAPETRTSDASSEAYWRDHNVTLHKKFSSVGESLEYLDWRNSQYIDYEKFLPVSSHEGEVVLDYGCGPGHDLVGFMTYSRPVAVYGLDVSQTSLTEAASRLDLHNYRCKLIQISESDERLPINDSSVDYVHCSGVLNHVPDPERVLKEFWRILRPSGYARLMVYNRDSIWFQLYASYILPSLDIRYRDLPIEEAFRRSTDGFDCPISRSWTVEEMVKLARVANFQATHIGNCISLFEMTLLPQRFAPIMNPSFRLESRKFLSKIVLDARGVPFVDGQVAGIDGCYELRKSR